MGSLIIQLGPKTNSDQNAYYREKERETSKSPRVS
jgi:hypothetical protein